MTKLFNYIVLLMTSVLLVGCVEDDALLVHKDFFFDYEIEQVPVETDYLLGAHYSRFSWRAAVPEDPMVGRYDANSGDVDAYAQHIIQAQTAGIDYFLFLLRSTNNPANYEADTAFISRLQTASNASEMKFAVSYNVGSLGLNNNNRIEDVGRVATLLNDFELMIPFFEQSNYMTIGDKHVVYMLNSHNFHANDNAEVYRQLREHMSNLGVELFLIGHQPEWTPPLRFDFRFVNGVDALTHATYALININWTDRWVTFHRMIDQAWSYHQEALAKYDIEYIPTISPSMNRQIENPGANFIVIEKDKEWFSGVANVARKVSGAHNLILLDSFNDWNWGTQVEAANTYGEEYLELLRKEFKRN